MRSEDCIGLPCRPHECQAREIRRVQPYTLKSAVLRMWLQVCPHVAAIDSTCGHTKREWANKFPVDGEIGDGDRVVHQSGSIHTYTPCPKEKESIRQMNRVSSTLISHGVMHHGFCCSVRPYHTFQPGK